jgi:hypothetical protein
LKRNNKGKGAKPIVLSKEPLKNHCHFLDKKQLIKVKLKAVRKGVWFRALSRIDRVLVDLTIRVADSIRSVSLAKCISVVTRKLEGLLESKITRLIREIGVPLACKLSMFAQKWGNRAAQEWTKDMSFVRYLAVMKLNGHSNENR